MIEVLARRGALLLFLALLWPTAAGAQGFSALVSPPRFEDSAKPGTTYRNIVEINNVSDERARFRVHTADWSLDPQGGVTFVDALTPGSCRPWVGVEAAEISLRARGKRRYRFEVAVPADAPSGECRFALMIEGDPQTVPGAVALPVAGRIGVIVYLAIGDAAPLLDVTATGVRGDGAQAWPQLQVRNRGNAHGRLEGLIDGTDARGQRFVFAPASLPILPGETRSIVLQPQSEDPAKPAPAIAWPLRLKGRLNGGRQRLAIEATVSQ